MQKNMICGRSKSSLLPSQPQFNPQGGCKSATAVRPSAHAHWEAGNIAPTAHSQGHIQEGRGGRGEFSVRYLKSGNAWVIYHYLSPNELLVRGLKFNNKEMCQLSVTVLPALCRKAIDLWRDVSKFNSEFQTALQWHMLAIVWRPCCLILLTCVTGLSKSSNLSMAWRLELCLGYLVLCDRLSM